MIYNKYNFSIRVLAGGGNPFYGDSLHITKEYTEVTNGHYLVRVYIPVDNNVDELPDCGYDVAEDFNGRVISTKLAKDVEDSIPKSCHIPILKNAWITKNTTDKKIEFCTNDLEVVKPIISNVEESKYANTEAVIPKETPEIDIGFDPDYMIKILQQFKKMGIDVVNLEIFGDDRAMKLNGETYEKQKIVAVLMPKKKV